MDPTGNITALVETEVPEKEQPSAASEIMLRHPEVEQVGFVIFSDSGSGPFTVSLRMAGGEFCGNAAMSAAALFLIRRNESDGLTDHKCRPARVPVKVSGTEAPVEVLLKNENDTDFHAEVMMPAAKDVAERVFVCDGIRGKLPVVFMDGISHIMIDPGSVFYGLLSEREKAERVIREWCGILSAEGLGLMFIEPSDPMDERIFRFTPLVHVPLSNTVFWENSCASGSAAAGMYLSEKYGAPVSVTLQEPGGIMSVKSDHPGGMTVICGKTRLTEVIKTQ